MRRAVLTLLLFAGVTACGEEPPEPRPVETEVPEELQANRPAPAVPAEEAGIGTPLDERVATLGVLNKRNNVSQDIEMSPGETRRIGPVIVRLQSCERTAPWEMPQETGAFVQVHVQDSEGADFRRIFSGWLFKNSPSLNVVEHPIYDVWVKDCAMDFPGEEDGDEADDEAEQAEA
ncbi:DUF2155 domain-containing protein [Qipengyuania sp. MTN3-11]|uniref:DUF2155 domain-containing protein n=1 Tax=Qipengyuania sp. MTN3-11 TaxID=3056557 RepID=UPI0036F4469F